MTDPETMMAVARLDGVEVVQNSDYFTLGTGGKNYLVSRDAVIPVIVKVCNTEALQTKFNYALFDILKADGVDTNEYGWTWVLVIKATARQLCAALLKTVNPDPISP